MAVEFVPNQFHGVHGRLKVADADGDAVYFYRYRARYRAIIEAP